MLEQECYRKSKFRKRRLHRSHQQHALLRISESEVGSLLPFCGLHQLSILPFHPPPPSPFRNTQPLLTASLHGAHIPFVLPLIHHLPSARQSLSPHPQTCPSVSFSRPSSRSRLSSAPNLPMVQPPQVWLHARQTKTVSPPHVSLPIVQQSPLCDVPTARAGSGQLMQQYRHGTSSRSAADFAETMAPCAPAVPNATTSKSLDIIVCS